MTEQKEGGESKTIAMEDDWRMITEKMTSEREQYQYMQEHEILTDCTFVVGPKDGETRVFKAHRMHIARVSPVFETMLLRVDMMEAKTGHVRVTDLSPNAFRLLLNSIYGKDPETKSFHEAQELAFAAHKYQMKALLTKGVTLMSELITPENIWTALETADLLQETRLKKKCVLVLQYQTMQCIANPKILQTSEENLALLLEQDELNVDNELSLVNVIVHWARHAARQRGLSGDDSGVRAVLEPRLLSLFRFLAMSHQQFMLGPGLASWLTDDEKSAISECRLYKKLDWPQHLSCARERKRISDRAGKGNAHIECKGMLICKRGIIGCAQNTCQFEKECCSESVSAKPAQFYNRLPVTGKEVKYNCIHAKLIFRVKSSCQWLGFQCASQYRTDPTLLSARHPLYMENIVTRTYTYNRTLSTEFDKILIGETFYRKPRIEWNSTISVLFDKPIPLVPDNWFSVSLEYRRLSTDGKSDKILYLNPSRATEVCTESGIEFVFHTDNQKGYHSSYIDGVIEGIIFSL